MRNSIKTLLSLLAFFETIHNYNHGYHDNSASSILFANAQLLSEMVAELLPIPEMIVGGRVVERFVPFMAGIEQCAEFAHGKCWDWQFICGASIIGHRWLLSAAHCFKDSVPTNHYRVFYSTMTLIDVNKTAEIDQRFVHKGFDPVSALNDIALIKLVPRLDLSHEEARRIALNRNHPITSNTTLTVYGYGFGSYHENLSFARGFVSTEKDCKKRWKGQKFVIGKKQFCMKVVDSDAGSGDSGGPVEIRIAGYPFLTGIVSFGDVHESENAVNQNTRPGVYTDVKEFMDWIEKIVLNNVSAEDEDDVLVNQFRTYQTLPVIDISNATDTEKLNITGIPQVEIPKWNMEKDDTLYVKPVEIGRSKDWPLYRILKTVLSVSVYITSFVIACGISHFIYTYCCQEIEK